MAAKPKTAEPELSAVRRLAALRAELEHVQALADEDAVQEHELRMQQCPRSLETGRARGQLVPQKAEADLAAARVDLIRGKATQADVDRLIAERERVIAAIRELEERKAARAAARKAILDDIEALVEAELPAFVAEGRRLSQLAHDALASVIGEDAIQKAHAAWTEAAAFWRWLERQENGMLHRDFVTFDTSVPACPLPDQATVERASAEPEAVRIAAVMGHVDRLGEMLTFRRHDGMTVDVAVGSREAQQLADDPGWTPTGI